MNNTNIELLNTVIDRLKKERKYLEGTENKISSKEVKALVTTAIYKYKKIRSKASKIIKLNAEMNRQGTEDAKRRSGKPETRKPET